MIRSKKDIVVIVFSTILIVSLFIELALAVQPDGAIVTPGTPQTAPTDAAGNNSAFAGNITYLAITGTGITPTWQGYFGNVSGAIELADSSGNVIYNWTLTEPSGEVYSSTNSSITWGNIQCFNFTANGTGGLGTAGSTNLGGANLTVLESTFNIGSSDADGVNETFSFVPAGDGHDAFTTASLSFGAGECLSTKLFNSGGGQASNQFEEVLLFEPATSSVVFTSLLEEGALNGFNSQDNDFQMMVLEDGHNSDVSATPYFFFVEIE